MADPLERYNAKRDFTRTAEPAGTLEPGKGNSFIVQKHDATRLHWDFRLEVDGVLKSWAVTRGPSLDPDEKRLAVRTEDHPLSYATFEGTIPEGQYGGGTVMLWDRGTWSPVAGKSAKDLEDGHLHFILDGERMKGEWLLVRMKPRAKEKRENWLLRKVADAQAGGTDTLTDQALTSVATGRTMAQIAEGKPPKKTPTRKPKVAARKAKAKNGTLPEFRSPALCTLVDQVPAGNGWLHEIKYDGYRALIAIGGGKAQVFTRSGLDWSAKFPGIVAAAADLPVTSALIDGEIVAFKNGRPDFSTLKDAIGTDRPMSLFAFDLLSLDGEDLTGLPLVQRKERLRGIIPKGDETIQFAEHITGSGEALFDKLCAEGLEGIVSKRADSRYPNGRSRDWLKIKCLRRQEFVIVGWLPSDKARRGLKSLLLGVNRDGKLAYAGKVGTGFTQQRMAELRALLDARTRKTTPVEAPRAMVRGAHWVRPDLVAEIAFTETTPDGLLRHPSFIGLREDKPADQVVEERPAPVPSPEASAITITHPYRVIFPDSDLTKGDLADYVAKLAPLMLPWVARRPVSLVRCPQGRARACFFQKHDAGSFGSQVHSIPIREKDGGTFILNSRDLCMIEHLNELIDAGIDSFKIEGRMKSAYYTAVVTNAYRHAIDAVRQKIPLDPIWVEETEKVSHRPYCTGFYYGDPGQHYGSSSYSQTADIVAVVESCDGDGNAILTQRNRFSPGDTLELMNPETKPLLFKAEILTDTDGTEIPDTRHPMMRLCMKLPVSVPKYTIIRKPRSSV